MRSEPPARVSVYRRVVGASLERVWEILLELIIDRAKGGYTARTLEGVGASTEIRTRLESRQPQATAIEIGSLEEVRARAPIVVDPGTGAVRLCWNASGS